MKSVTDKERLDWLERRMKRNFAGSPIWWCMADDCVGFRHTAMRGNKTRQTIRGVIDDAMKMVDRSYRVPHRAIDAAVKKSKKGRP